MRSRFLAPLLASVACMVPAFGCAAGGADDTTPSGSSADAGERGRAEGAAAPPGTGGPASPGTPEEPAAAGKGDASAAPSSSPTTPPTSPTTPPASSCAPASLGANCHAVINEVQALGPGGAGDEFIELANPCTFPFPLTGWSLVYRSAAGTTDVSLLALDTYTVAAGGYVVFASKGWTGGVPVGSFGSTTGSLADKGGGIAIVQGNLTLDSMGWGTATNSFVKQTAAVVANTDQSLSRKPDGCDTGNNGADFVSQAPTPGSANR